MRLLSPTPLLRVGIGVLADDTQSLVGQQDDLAKLSPSKSGETSYQGVPTRSLSSGLQLLFPCSHYYQSYCLDYLTPARLRGCLAWYLFSGNDVLPWAGPRFPFYLVENVAAY